MLLVFLILLSALIISVLFGIKIKGEGFIGFKKDVGIVANQQKYLSVYENNLMKLFDNNYFDTKTGNVVVIDGSGDETIYGYSVINRNGTKKHFKPEEQWSEKTMTTITEAYSSWDTDVSNAFSQNHLYYIPYKKETYMYICDTSVNIGHHCYRFKNEGATTDTGIDTQYIPVSKIIVLPTGISFSDSKNNQLVDLSNSKFKKQMLQIRPGILYDKTTGYLITDTSNNAEPTIYDRKGDVYTSAYPTTFQSVSITDGKSLSAFVIKQETYPTKYVVVMTNIKDTIILAISSNKLDYAWRIDANGKDWSGTEVQKSNGGQMNQSDKNRDIDIKQSYPPIPTNDWWNDYMRKTEIVPPVCPACPSCPVSGGSGTCVNCGGGGGVGAGGAGGVGGVIGSAVGTTGNVANNAINTAGGLVQSAGSTAAGLAGYTLGSATGLAKDAASGTVGLGKDVVSGTVGLGKDVVSGTVGLGKDVVSGTVGLGKDVVSGTLGAVKDTASGTANFIKSLGSGATQVGGGGGGGGGGYTENPKYPIGPLDPYTYNGSLSQKPQSNFVPVTADFSRFGR